MRLEDFMCFTVSSNNENMSQLNNKVLHSGLMVNLIKLFWKRKQLLQHECLTPIESGITSSQILQIQN